MSEYKDLLPLIIDPDPQSKALLRKLQAAFGVDRIMTAQATDDALKMLRRELHANDVAVPVVLVCAKIDAAKVTAARDAGMNDVISKPVNLPAIERQLRTALA